MLHSSSNPAHATHPTLHLRDAADALVVFEAVRLGMVPLIKRRLTTEERDYLSSGNVFVWEEAEHKGGLERWTDGRRWSQSRMKGDFLFYEEKVETTQEEKEAKAARRAFRASGSPTTPTGPVKRQDRPAKPDGLTKQTYSTYVNVPGVSSSRKWHIVAYFSGNDYTRLPVVENYEYFRNIRVPDDVFFSSKTWYRDYTPFTVGSPLQPAEFRPHNLSPNHGAIQQTVFASQSAKYGEDQSSGSWSRSNSPESHTSSVPHTASGPPLPRRTNSSPGPAGPSHPLPRLASVAPLQPHPFSPTATASSSASHRPRGSSLYAPLSQEDKRALGAFKVVL